MRIHGLHMENFAIKTIKVMTGVSSLKASRPLSLPAIRYPKFLQDSNRNYRARFYIPLIFSCLGVLE